MVWKAEITALRKIRERPISPRIITELAQELGVHRATLYRWLVGKTEPRRRRKDVVRKTIEKYRTYLDKP